ncbi:AAA family ATPase [Spirosoma sp. KCTC 42546]|uniref:TrlF family AAA-like ATPase n=1 Tax=Spirosoma sp. KCTC 42546 TaxID=2520506 RepID=UPI001158F74E|nr:AAA family ATPase [Spirosoma sp. KCTC 42546]QDK77969.1 AAA family ATPase [Spirosoma sp. KCTC 42546]
MNPIHKGADYRKADLQLHSPRDRNWEGVHPEQKLSNASLEDIKAVRRKWASEFIDNCLEKGVQVAALTDHHEGVYCWHVIEELKFRNASFSEDIDLWFMPGMELTCKDSAQALILFDADITKPLFEKARNLLRLPTECYDDQLQGIEVTLLDFNIDEIQGVLEHDSELRDRFIILPNVTPGGHKTVLRTGFHKRFKELPYVGGYLDKVYPSDLKDGDQRILDGQIPAWTSEKRGIISTSDARSSDFSALGTFATWVKLAEPTAESLRQAMLAADSRILYESPNRPTLLVKSISVSGAEFLSLPEPLSFSHQFTSIIGGRGSGKSTLLEFIRFAVGQSALDVGDSKWDPTHDRRKNILKYALNESEGVVEVLIEKDGAIIELIRSRSTQDRIIMRVQNLEQAISPSDARKLFPIQAYSQGELSHLGDEKAEKRLFDLITEPQREALNQVEKNRLNVASELREHLEQAIKNWQYEKEYRKLNAQLITLKAGLDNTMVKLQAIPSETQGVMERYNIEIQTTRWLEQIIQEHQQSYDLLFGAFQNHLKLTEERLVAGKIPTAKVAQDLSILLLHQMETANDALRQLVTENQQYEQQQTELIINWNKGQVDSKSQYELAMSQLSQHKVELDQLKRLEREINEAQRSVDDLEQKIQHTKGAYILLTEKSGQYMALQRELQRLARKGISVLAELTDNLARAELSEKADLAELEQAIKDLFASSGVRADRLDKLLDHVATKDPIVGWWDLMKEVFFILKWNTTGLRETEKRPTLDLLDNIIDPGGLEKFCERLDIERVSRAITAIVRPRVRLLQKRGINEIEFSRASQGEKATILLNVLMRQEGGPLLLDQPEEDLDNRIIGDIVSATRQAKIKKQLLFATHNANLVVNGDAELVIDLTAGSISQIGAIDVESLRVSITDTMEGGKDAFELRRKKYNF